MVLGSRESTAGFAFLNRKLLLVSECNIVKEGSGL